MGKEKLNQASKEHGELLEELENAANAPKFQPFDSDGFARHIAETAVKTAQVQHRLEMRRIREKCKADITVELVRMGYTGCKVVADQVNSIIDEVFGKDESEPKDIAMQ